MAVTTEDWSVLGDLRCELGECPVWDETSARLYLVDISGQRLWTLDPTTGTASGATCDRPITALVPRAGGGWLGVSGRDVGTLDPDNGAFQPLLSLPGPSDLALNDAVCGRDGNLYVGSIDRTRAERADLYVVEPDLNHHVLAGHVGASNGVDTSPDGSLLYHADSFADTVTAYGQHGRSVYTVRVAHPDGIAVDADGGVWVASWGSGRLFRYTPDLAPDRALCVPAPLVTSVSFGGPGYRWMFVTTARSDDAELSGAVLTADVGVAGLPPARFAVQR